MKEVGKKNDKEMEEIDRKKWVKDKNKENLLQWKPINKYSIKGAKCLFFYIYYCPLIKTKIPIVL